MSIDELFRQMIRDEVQKIFADASIGEVPDSGYVFKEGDRVRIVSQPRWGNGDIHDTAQIGWEGVVDCGVDEDGEVYVDFTRNHSRFAYLDWKCLRKL
jgi:hypothetical protein